MLHLTGTKIVPVIRILANTLKQLFIIKQLAQKVKYHAAPAFNLSYNAIMSYQDSNIARDYIAFTNSENGQIQQDVLYLAILKYLDPNLDKDLLDAACGGGWLAGKLIEEFAKVQGCDFSPELIRHAHEQYPKVNFKVADVTHTLPYSDEQFDAVIFNMAAHDVHDLPKAFSEISRITKTNGKIILTIANPYYAFPVGVWKRGLLGFLLRRKPRLLVRPFHFFKRQSRQFTWNNKFTSYFYTLPEYIEHARAAQLQLTHMEDLESLTDTLTLQCAINYSVFRLCSCWLLKKLSNKVCLRLSG
jgi:ubiquinone/menaquinone biosynthesis C-methylase UbiE